MVFALKRAYKKKSWHAYIMQIEFKHNTRVCRIWEGKTAVAEKSFGFGRWFFFFTCILHNIQILFQKRLAHIAKDNIPHDKYVTRSVDLFICVINEQTKYMRLLNGTKFSLYNWNCTGVCEQAGGPEHSTTCP